MDTNSLGESKKFADLGVEDEALVGHGPHGADGHARERQRLDALRHGCHRVLAQLHLRTPATPTSAPAAHGP